MCHGLTGRELKRTQLEDVPHFEHHVQMFYKHQTRGDVWVVIIVIWPKISWIHGDIQISMTSGIPGYEHPKLRLWPTSPRMQALTVVEHDPHPGTQKKNAFFNLVLVSAMLFQWNDYPPIFQQAMNQYVQIPEVRDLCALRLCFFTASSIKSVRAWPAMVLGGAALSSLTSWAEVRPLVAPHVAPSCTQKKPPVFRSSNGCWNNLKTLSHSVIA